MNWQPVPAWVPWHALLASASGALLLGCGVGLLLRSIAVTAALVLSIFMLSWVVLLRVPPLLAGPSQEINWLGLGETTVLLTGCVSLFATLCLHEPQSDRSRMDWLKGESGQRTAMYVFALALPPIGLSHLVYANATVDLIPAWIPARLGWAYLTGAGHIAAGLGILFGVLPRLAGMLEAAMMGIFTLLVWLPRVVTEPSSRLNWTALFVSAALASCAQIVVRSIPASMRVPRRGLRHEESAVRPPGKLD